MHPAKAFCHAALRQRCPPGPVKAVGPTGVHLRILYPKLVLQIISALCRVFSLIASRGFESRIIHTRSYTGGRIIAQPGLNSVVGNELMKKKKKKQIKTESSRFRVCPCGEVAGIRTERNFRAARVRLFVPMETSLCHPPWDQCLDWDNCRHRENSPAFSSRPRKSEKEWLIPRSTSGRVVEG